MNKVNFLILIFVFFAGSVIGQEQVVQGVVNTFDSIPLIGVQVQVKSTKQVVLTDSLGNFSALCNSKDKLKISADGFYKSTVSIKKNTKVVAVNLKMKQVGNDDEYNIGYGYISEENRSIAAEAASYSDNNFHKYSNMYDLIRSQFAVDIRNGQVFIRGGNKSFQGSSAALIVLDGSIMDSDILSTLSPLDIKNLSILKDSSASVYGARGANGVLLIETKKGGER